MHKFLDCLELKTRRNLGAGLRAAVVAALLVIAPAVGAHEKHKQLTDNYPSDVASVWFDTLYDVIKSEATPPPPASRIYGVTAVALYESVVSGTEENRSLVGQLNGLNALPEAGKRGKYHWPTVANAVLAETIRGIFISLKPENLEAINALEADIDAQFQADVRSRGFERSMDYGKEIANAVGCGSFRTTANQPSGAGGTSCETSMSSDRS